MFTDFYDQPLEHTDGLFDVYLTRIANVQAKLLKSLARPTGIEPVFSP